jgi:hypothetical protein
MVLAGQFAVGFLDVGIAGVFVHFQYLVIIYEFHIGTDNITVQPKLTTPGTFN